MEKIIQEIRDERDYQKSKWGDDFDSKNTPNDWLAYIVSYAGKSLTFPWNAQQFRTALVKVAALCIAAIEWCDRSGGSMAKRHYD